MSEQLKYSGPTACPFCGSHDPQKVSFTWWGGLIGPAILHHVKCGKCGKGYNGKSGRSNTTAITVYLVVTGVITLAILGIWFVGMAMYAFTR